MNFAPRFISSQGEVDYRSSFFHLDLTPTFAMSLSFFEIPFSLYKRKEKGPIRVAKISNLTPCCNARTSPLYPLDAYLASPKCEECQKKFQWNSAKVESQTGIFVVSSWLKDKRTFHEKAFSPELVEKILPLGENNLLEHTLLANEFYYHLKNFSDEFILKWSKKC